MKLLTIFTPTYNRAGFLPACYQSLLLQTDKSFIWQVVDDGSIDNTRPIIEGFIRQGELEIEYIFKPNGGKASAVNASLEKTNTPLWLCLDSDDTLLPEAVRIIADNYPQIKDEPSLCGLFAVRSHANGQPMGGKAIPAGLDAATQGYIRYKKKVPPEYVQAYKTDIVRAFPFPVFAGETFMPESFAQDQIDQKYRFKILQKPLMVCQYLPNGLTHNYYRLIARNPQSMQAFYSQRIKIIPYLLPRIQAALLYNALTHIHKPAKPMRSFLLGVTAWGGYYLYRKKLREYTVAYE